MKHGATLLALAALASLSGCISFGADAPDQLLTLTPATSLPAGSAREGDLTTALAIQAPSVAQRLNVTRIPVTTSDSTLAYLPDAVWVEKPAQLFRNVLAETIRARGSRLVVDGAALEYGAATQLMGELVEMGYDAPRSSVVVRYDAVLTLPDGTVRTQRFEHSISGVLPEANAVSAALNTAANRVAGEVADWVG
jgi:cholesterol transport system auxiliary component